jgi:Asp-tRNA(Asn)/Glu-tRNA(Gln) amidotransferase A subunit family amidase
MAGLPVGVQIVGPPYSEELVLAAMKSCQDALKATE